MFTHIQEDNSGLQVASYISELMDAIEKEISIALDNTDTIDLSAIPACAVINLTGAGSYTKNKIIPPNWVHELTIRPASTTSIIWNDKVIGTSGANLRLGSAQKITDGALYSFIKLQKRTVNNVTEMYETGFLDSYNS